MKATDYVAVGAMLALLMSCGCSRPAVDGPDGRPTEKPGAAPTLPPQTKADLGTLKQEQDKLEQVAAQEFGKIKDRLIADAGPGGAALNASIRRDAPIAFSLVPESKLLQEEAPGGAGNALESLTTDRHRQFIYPIMRGNQVVSSLLLGLNNAPGGAPEVRVLDDGSDSRFAKVIEFAKKKNEANLPADAAHPSYKGIYIPALNQQFLYYDEGNVTKMVPLSPNPANGFEVGKALPAGHVVSKLRASAQAQSTRERAPG